MSWSQLRNVATGEAIALVLVLAATGLFRLDRWRYRRNITESTRTPHSSTQPLRPHGILKPADLQQSIEYSARIPLEFRPHPKRLRAIRQTSKLFFIANRTTPKQAFRISCWRYQPNTFRDTNRRFDPHGGFIFSFRIHENENRWHFRHSLRAGGFIAPSTALVVIASAKDLATPAAWVRCLVVSSLFQDLPKDRRGPIAVQSSDPLADNESSAYSVRLQYVPEHAIWLITTDPQHTVPTTDWHKSPESLEFPESLEYPQTPPQQQKLENYDRYIKQGSRERFRFIFGAGLFLGPIIGFLFFGPALLVALYFGAGTVTLALIVGLVWFLASIFALEMYYLLMRSTPAARGCIGASARANATETGKAAHPNVST